jgi:hypothetical protein
VHGGLMDRMGKARRDLGRHFFFPALAGDIKLLRLPCRHCTSASSVHPLFFW